MLTWNPTRWSPSLLLQKAQPLILPVSWFRLKRSHPEGWGSSIPEGIHALVGRGRNYTSRKTAFLSLHQHRLMARSSSPASPWLGARCQDHSVLYFGEYRNGFFFKLSPFRQCSSTLSRLYHFSPGFSGQCCDILLGTRILLPFPCWLSEVGPFCSALVWNPSLKNWGTGLAVKFIIFYGQHWIKVFLSGKLPPLLK